MTSPTVSLDGSRILFAGRKHAGPGGGDLPGRVTEKTWHRSPADRRIRLRRTPPLRYAADGSVIAGSRKCVDYDDVDPTDRGQGRVRVEPAAGPWPGPLPARRRCGSCRRRPRPARCPRTGTTTGGPCIRRPDPVQFVEPEPRGGRCRPYRGPAGDRRGLLRDRLDRPMDGCPSDAGREPVWLRGQDSRAGVAAAAAVQWAGRLHDSFKQERRASDRAGGLGLAAGGAEFLEGGRCPSRTARRGVTLRAGPRRPRPAPFGRVAFAQHQGARFSSRRPTRTPRPATTGCGHRLGRLVRVGDSASPVQRPGHGRCRTGGSVPSADSDPPGGPTADGDELRPEKPNSPPARSTRRDGFVGEQVGWFALAERLPGQQTDSGNEPVVPYPRA